MPGGFSQPSILSVLRTLSLSSENMSQAINRDRQQTGSVPASINTKMPDFDEILSSAIDEIWELFDVDGDGCLDKRETRDFVDFCMNNQQNNEKINDQVDESKLSDQNSEDDGPITPEQFEEYFKKVDQDGNGLLEKEEMLIFLKELMERAVDNLSISEMKQYQL